jgi:hypothetical protein
MPSCLHVAGLNALKHSTQSHRIGLRIARRRSSATCCTLLATEKNAWWQSRQAISTRAQIVERLNRTSPVGCTLVPRHCRQITPASVASAMAARVAPAAARTNRTPTVRRSSASAGPVSGRHPDASCDASLACFCLRYGTVDPYRRSGTSFDACPCVTSPRWPVTPCAPRP